MPLDFAILSEDGTPAESVALPMDLHDELITQARELKLRQILRFRNYFEDVETRSAELPALKKEVDSLRLSANQGSTTHFLLDFNRLIELAIIKRQTLYAIAD
jgi:hypothetical protein